MVLYLISINKLRKNVSSPKNNHSFYCCDTAWLSWILYIFVYFVEIIRRSRNFLMKIVKHMNIWIYEYLNLSTLFSNRLLLPLLIRIFFSDWWVFCVGVFTLAWKSFAYDCKPIFYVHQSCRLAERTTLLNAVLAPKSR